MNPVRYAPVAALAAVLMAGCGTTAVVPSPRLTVHGAVVSVRFGPGRQHAAVRVARPQGAVLLYRVSAPTGARVRASVELHRVSVRLFAGNVRPADSESCSTLRRRTVCTVSIEWCPLPAGAWDVRVAKLGGPAGVVDVVLHVAVPPSARRA